jgi:hypothetical protein
MRSWHQETCVRAVEGEWEFSPVEIGKRDSTGETTVGDGRFCCNYWLAV